MAMITVTIGFLDRSAENIGLESVSSMHIFTNECIRSLQ